jgi:TolA-binding protein
MLGLSGVSSSSVDGSKVGELDLSIGTLRRQITEIEKAVVPSPMKVVAIAGQQRRSSSAVVIPQLLDRIQAFEAEVKELRPLQEKCNVLNAEVAELRLQLAAVGQTVVEVRHMEHSQVQPESAKATTTLANSDVSPTTAIEQ